MVDEGVGSVTGSDRVVFVHTNDPAANEILAFRRDAHVLTRTGAYPTGGRGSAQQGAPADPLASQHSLAYDRQTGLLYAVNAGSGTLSVFSVDGASLQPVQTLPTNGDFPASVAVSRDLVYVLNAGGDGSVTGYRVGSSGLAPIPGSQRGLDLRNATVPFFLSSPGQIGFTPDGRQLLVTTKNHDEIRVFALAEDGTPSAEPVVNASAGPVPFSFVFDPAGHLVVAEASGALSSYAVGRDGTLDVLSASVRNGQQATCWLVSVGDFLYAVNAGSGTVSGYAVDEAGGLRLLDAEGVSAVVGAGAIDAATDGEYLYVENGAAATLHPFRVGTDGSLTPLPVVDGLPRFGGHSVEGIVAL
jgi:6-phosphogluconolactonase (cycloisomerase 2 family)